MKKSFLLNLLILIASLGFYLFTKNFLFSGAILLILLFMRFYYIKAKDNTLKKIKKNKEYELGNVISYLVVFLENGFNVYQSLRLASNYCSKYLSEDINKLIDEIDKDKSMIPYQNFAVNYDSPIILQILTMLYQLDSNGYDAKYLSKFPSLINKMREAKIKSILDVRKSNMSFLTVLPIVCLLVVVFSFSVYILDYVGGSI